ncbi:hypothetical protein [Streptomyces sp. NPDC056982]|uniref:hypothetical protein n=1 Tax=Streptomyces sp. NPDC056982 TaxID=3345986 RepID=UPI0036276447
MTKASVEESEGETAVSPRTQARVEARKRRLRGNYLAVGAAVFASAALAAVLTGFLILSRDLTQANDARDKLAAQVEGLGGDPVAGPPGSRGAPGQTVVGKRGPAGPAGPSGASGKPAPTITPKPGPAGPTGPAGADSTVAGPTGPAGQDATGAPGKDGQNGKDGTDGKNGTPPSQWTFTDQNGTEYQCTPVDNFDPDNPRYKCTPTSTAPASPDPSPSSTPNQQPSNDTTTPAGLLGLLDRRRT